ncbi:MAG: sugar phosphate isomerase/epimerase [Candidatus Aminicenantes bacterium]|nr:sugar phosphate isomerase/epimerase [Candidatus Aminicenantes bacterium]
MKKISRRAFVQGSMGALAGAVIQGRPGSGAGRTSLVEHVMGGSLSPASAAKFELGIASYTFREFDLDSALVMAGRIGLVRIAVKSVHLPLESSEEETRAAAAKIRAAGLVPYGCGVVYMTSEAEVDQAFAYARAGGMEVIIGVPGHELLGRAEQKVRETGIKLAVHNHGPGDLLYPTPASILDRVKKMDPRIGLCLDIGHCQRSGIDPSEAAAACGPRLLDVHLKDVTAPTKDGTAVEAGRGVIDLPRFLRALATMDYRGTAAFEYEKDGQDPLPGLAESVGYVRGVLAAQEKQRGRS